MYHYDYEVDCDYEVTIFYYDYNVENTKWLFFTMTIKWKIPHFYIIIYFFINLTTE